MSIDYLTGQFTEKNLTDQKFILIYFLLLLFFLTTFRSLSEAKM